MKFVEIFPLKCFLLYNIRRVCLSTNWMTSFQIPSAEEAVPVYWSHSFFFPPLLLFCLSESISLAEEHQLLLIRTTQHPSLLIFRPDSSPTAISGQWMRGCCSVLLNSVTTGQWALYRWWNQSRIPEMQPLSLSSLHPLQVACFWHAKVSVVS